MLRRCPRQIVRRIRRRHRIIRRSTRPQTEDRKPRLFNDWTAATRTSPSSPSSTKTCLQWAPSPVFHVHVPSPAISKLSLLHKLQLVWSSYTALPRRTATLKEVSNNRSLRRCPPQQRYFASNVVLIIRLIAIVFFYVWSLFHLSSHVDSISLILEHHLNASTMYYTMYFTLTTLLERGTIYVQGTTNRGCTWDYFGQCTEIVVKF